MVGKGRKVCIAYFVIIFSIIYTDSVQALSNPYLNVWQIGTFGTGDGQFYYATDVAVDTQGNIYVTDPDGKTSRMQTFTSDGIYVTKWGSYGNGDGQFRFPEGIAVDESGFIYVADTFNNRIQKFSPNGA